MSIKVLPSECDCEICSRMCKAPCCGTVEDIQKLIDAGYGHRLMLDDWPGDCSDIIKPAMKDYEGRTAPWSTRMEDGCTFWKDGKCELHDSGLKPIQGKLAHHSNNNDQEKSIADIIRKSWAKKKASKIIENWKKKYFKTNIEEDE